MLYNKKVAIYLAIHNHYSLLDTILKAIETFNCSVTLFITPELKQNYENDIRITEIQYITQKSFIKKSQVQIMNLQDFVVFDELTSFKELMAFSFFNIKTNKVMVVHDCDSWFKPSVPKGAKNYLKYTFSRIVKSKFKAFGVAGSNMKRYLQQNLIQENIFLIPFRYADFNEPKDVSPEYSPGEKVRICIPGTISKRRNYDKLLDNLCTPVLKHKVVVDVLGQAIGEYGSRIIDRIKELNQNGFEILYQEGYINNDSFDESVRKAHLVLSDFEPDYYTNNGQKEIYGITKETGVAVLMLNKAKVGLLPASFNQMEEIKNQTLFYKDEKELANVISSIYEGTFINFGELQKNALENARRMDIALISKEIEAAYQVQINAN